ncbi:cysteine synthase A [Rothia sp. HMSC066H02]|uniref:cysteine synthase A n=1 Tax=Rothia TaxID=32207 RepID=UPI00066DACF4|nr:MULTISPECIES: cysteine synthase A [Rothia]MBF1666140.1 cysteine synthase A [Rothia sp. (in: high G+C Gram-positive bacteria)]MBF1669123.1 cysteine synthase A [Rothia sp. (in: high G+C Gram-positive bacteria)]MBS6980520.1 cysteine synthase A [Rothia mucilaginosa]OFO96963.1 cysteine synthase A [Rothia sp. HMSC065D09]OFP13390.1 cysteine synthase A [Rothia sp. HMSC066H02]
MAKILNSIVEATGQTPLVKLNRLDEGLPGNVAVKLEFYNPAGSVKDRIGRAIIDAAEKSGALKPGGTIVEGTSGNTGIALAMVGAARGYRVILTMPETMSAERRVLLRAYGAQIVLTPGTEGMRGAVEKAKEIVATTENAILASQFSNEANPAIHYNTTGPEIWEATDGKVDIFVAGIGTGGTISGTGKYLKEQNPNVKVVAVEPKDSPLLSEGRVGPHKIQGLGANFVPDTLDRGIYDSVTPVSAEDAMRTSRLLATQEGILGGISSGAAVWAALEEAKKSENKDKLIVAIVPDFGERYISTALYEDIRG